jgi:hypothetical protein
METRKQHIKIIPCSLLLFIFGFSFLVLGDDDRHTVVDQAIGGMEQGSRIFSQGSYDNKGNTSGNHPSSAAIGNHGYIFTGSGLPNASQANKPLTAETIVTTGETHPATETGNSGTTTQEQPGTSNNPIVAVDANINPNSGTPNAGVQVDTSGQLEDRQILDADVTGAGTGSSAQVGSATDITGQELVHEADITAEPAAGTGPVAPEQINTGSSTAAQEPSGTSGNPIVSVETGTNPESGIPNAGVAVDTTGELEDKQILQTDLAAEGITSSEQVGSASDITGSETIHSVDITTQPAESAIPIPSDLSAEVDTTGQTVGGVADVGEEADISGISESEDVTCNPTDGLTSTPCGPLKL